MIDDTRVKFPKFVRVQKTLKIDRFWRSNLAGMTLSLTRLNGHVFANAQAGHV